MNTLCLTGHAGSDAEVRSTPTGKQITSWNVAMTSGWGDNKKTTWIRCSMWGDRGVKLSSHILKGGLMGITGEFSTREWEKDGVTRTSCELNVNDVTLMGSPDRAKYNKAPSGSQREQGQAASAAQNKAEGNPPDFGDFEDDIPF